MTFDAKKTKVKTSGHGVIDITTGRTVLSNHFGHRVGSPAKVGLPIPIIIYGYIDGVHGHDCGVSREFMLDIEKIELKNSGETL